MINYEVKFLSNELTLFPFIDLEAAVICRKQAWVLVLKCIINDSPYYS